MVPPGWSPACVGTHLWSEHLEQRQVFLRLRELPFKEEAISGAYHCQGTAISASQAGFYSAWRSLDTVSLVDFFEGCWSSCLQLWVKQTCQALSVRILAAFDVMGS